MKALVTGATGFVGSVLCKELANNGYEVRALVHTLNRAAALNGIALTCIEGDLCDKDSLINAMRDVDVVFHLGALYREARFADEMYWKVNFEGTRNALEAAQQAHVKRFLHCSTTGVMGHIEQPPAGEDHPYHPGDVYQESKTEAEKLVLSWLREGKIDGCIIRPTMIWRPNDTRLFKLFKGVASRTLPIIGTGRTLNHYVLVDDLARAFRLAAETPGTRGELYLVGGQRYVTLEYTMQCIAKIYGVSLLPIRIPVGPLLFLGSVVEHLCRPFGIEPPIHRRRVEFFVKSRAFDCSKAQRDFGYRPTYSFEEELAYVARWYVENGWIKLASTKAQVAERHG